MALCQITLVGNVGRDPEVRYTPNGKSVTTFSVAVNQGRKDPTTGSWTDETDWFRVTVWGEAGERVAEKVRRGSKVVVSGRFRSRTWEKDGVKQTSLEVSATEVVPMGLPAGNAAPGGSTTGTEGEDELSSLPF